MLECDRHRTWLPWGVRSLRGCLDFRVHPGRRVLAHVCSVRLCPCTHALAIAERHAGHLLDRRVVVLGDPLLPGTQSRRVARPPVDLRNLRLGLPCSLAQEATLCSLDRRRVAAVPILRYERRRWQRVDPGTCGLSCNHYWWRGRPCESLLTTPRWLRCRWTVPASTPTFLPTPASDRPDS